MARIDQFPRVSVAGAGLFVASVALMHAVQPELSPVDMAVSYYMTGRLGWALGAGLVLLGIASLSLALGLRHCLTPAGAGAGLWLFAVWAIGVIVCGLFPPDPPGHWDEPPSLSGMIHGAVALIALLAFSPAAWLLSRRLAGLLHKRLDVRILESLAILSALCLLAFFVCLWPVFVNRAPYALGFVERVLLALNVAWLVTAAVSIPRYSQIVDATSRTSSTQATLR
jgi:hypothetical protein